MADKAEEKNPAADADAIEEKFGSFAEVYAENRIEAADIAGNDAGKEHWEKVAATLPQEGDK
jgi:hypothetical protein